MLAGTTPDEAFASLILRLDSLEFNIALDEASYFLSFADIAVPEIFKPEI
jgi:hypothetical protein